MTVSSCKLQGIKQSGCAVLITYESHDVEVSIFRCSLQHVAVAFATKLKKTESYNVLVSIFRSSDHSFTIKPRAAATKGCFGLEE